MLKNLICFVFAVNEFFCTFEFDNNILWDDLSFFAVVVNVAVDVVTCPKLI